MITDEMRSIELSGGVRIAIDDGAEAVVERPGEATMRIALCERPEHVADLVVVVDDAKRAALMGARDGDRLLYVPGGGGPAIRIGLGERIPNAGQLAIRAIADGFFVLFENGLLALGPGGVERWRLDRVAFDWQIVEVREDVIWLADLHGNLLGFDLATGAPCD